MTYVITDPCAGTCDAACARVCPMDCIAGPVPLDELTLVPPAERPVRLARVQLYIDPANCIDCGACEPECPVNAIYPDDLVPPQYADAAARNAAFFARR